MPNKPVISIDIDDKQFSAFYQLFKQFQGELGEIPEEWKVIGESAGRSHEAMAAAAGVLVESLHHASDHANVLVQGLKEAGKAQRQFVLQTGEGEGVMKRIGKEAKELKNTLFGIGNFLMKLGVLGVGTAAGGLFGMEKLAQAVVGNQRQARSLGMSTGQLRAFNTDMGRYIDESALENIANAKNDLTQRVWLQRASGLTSQQIDQTSPGELAGKLALKMHDWWASTPASQHNTAFLQATGFPQIGFSLDDMRRLGATDRSELTRASSQYGVDSRSLNISNRDTDSLYTFSRQLDLAGKALQGAFTNRLAQLGPSLGGLVTTLEKDAEILINDVFSKENIRALESGVDSLTHFLGSQEFKDDVRVLADGIEHIGHVILATMKLLAPDTSPSNVDSHGRHIPLGQLVPSKLKPGEVDRHSTGLGYWENPDNGNPTSTFFHAGNYSTKKVLGGLLSVHDKYMGPYYEQMNPVTALGKKNAKELAALETTFGLPKGILLAQEMTESMGKLRAVSKKGAEGPFQIMPATAKQYGITNSFDFHQSAVGAAMMDRDLLKRYHGDMNKALAAYNHGQGNLDRDMAKPGEWKNNVPLETQHYIEKIHSLMSLRQPVKLEISNKSGTNVAVSTNAAAAG